MSRVSDLAGGAPADWLVIGWFTPDYRLLAEQHAASLTARGIPYHLFARSKRVAGWNTLQKPSVVLDAMDAHPGRTLILMDVDCIVDGDIEPVTRIAGDVGLTMNARPVRLLWPPHRRISVKAASRVVVFRPTDGARRFAEEWARRCALVTRGDDEAPMAAAFLCSLTGVSYAYIDRRYSGLNHVPGCVIRHDSAHNKQPPRGLGEWLKTVERKLRTGRTRASKEAGLSVTS
ncbi:MAG TPA: hypothetical protein VFZ16_17540 [Hyphomicrobiaceae bacterium]|nr:hypothetical protein [Hyphomicrobiaceae bacterium]